LGTNGEINVNSTGHKLKDFAAENKLKITNTFFRHKEIHKMTWSARGYKSLIDHVLTNKKLSPLVRDTKDFRGYDVATDHYLLISKMCLPQKGYTFIKISPRHEEVFRVHLLEDPSIKFLSEETRTKFDTFTM
jgi:hypothetical protein